MLRSRKRGIYNYVPWLVAGARDWAWTARGM